MGWSQLRLTGLSSLWSGLWLESAIKLGKLRSSCSWSLLTSLELGRNSQLDLLDWSLSWSSTTESSEWCWSLLSWSLLALADRLESKLELGSGLDWSGLGLDNLLRLAGNNSLRNSSRSWLNSLWSWSWLDWLWSWNSLDRSWLLWNSLDSWGWSWSRGSLWGRNTGGYWSDLESIRIDWSLNWSGIWSRLRLLLSKG